MKSKSARSTTAEQQDSPQPDKQLAETANRALAQIRNLGFVRRGQGKVRAMLEQVLKSRSPAARRQVSDQLAEKLERQGNALARAFAKELRIADVVHPPHTAVNPATVPDKKVKATGNAVLPSTPTSVLYPPAQMPGIDEREAAELRRWDRSVARSLKRAVQEIEKFARLCRKDSPDTAEQLGRLAGQIDAQRKARNLMVVTASKQSRQ